MRPLIALLLALPALALAPRAGAKAIDPARYYAQPAWAPPPVRADAHARDGQDFLVTIEDIPDPSSANVRVEATVTFEDGSTRRFVGQTHQHGGR